MKKCFLISVLLLSAPLISFAQQVLSMDSVFSSLTESPVTSGDFTLEKSAAKLKKPLKSSGTFVFCDEGVIWKTLKPFPSTMAVTKTSLIQIKSDGTKTVTDASSNEVFKSVAQTLSSIFSGKRESLEECFNVTSFDADSSSWTMKLIPKDRTIAAALNLIELGGNIKTKKASLDSIKIFQSQTDITTYSLINQQYRQELTDGEKALFK